MSKKTWAEQWGETPVDWRMNKKAATRLLKKVMNLTKRRVKAIEKSGVYSPAVQHILHSPSGKNYLDTKISEIDTIQKTTAMISILHDFWAAQSSSISGAKKLEKEQNARIWGTKANGTPLYTMNIDEARAYWALVNEYGRQHPETTHFDSTRIQAVIGEMYRAIGRPIGDPRPRYGPRTDSGSDLPAVNVTKFLDDTKKALQAEHDGDYEEYRQTISDVKEVFSHNGGFEI